MQNQLKTLFLGILILILVGFSVAFYRALNTTLPQLRPAPLMPASVSLINTSATTTSTTTNEPNTITVMVGTSTLTLELATTSAEQTQGLSGRLSLAPDRGILFIFDQTGTYGFWMKDMHFALDFIWLDGAGKVIAIDQNISPNTYPKVFYPPTPVKYVIEVNAGWSDSNDVKVGDTLSPLNF
jgi:uncharacterized membrane protein (UPF0127 family)